MSTYVRSSMSSILNTYFETIDPFHIVTSLSNHSSIEKSIKSFLLYEGADCLLVTLSKHILMLNKTIFWSLSARMRFLILEIRKVNVFMIIL